MGNKAKILSIDDEQGIRDLLSFELGQQGYQVVTAQNGLEGLEKVKQEKFDLAIIDIKMPGMDGVATLEKMKKIDPEIEVIIATGYATLETAVESLRKGACDYINKPFNIDEMIVVIEKTLERRQFKEMVALYEISKSVFSTIQLDALLKIITDSTAKVLKADCVCLILFKEKGRLGTDHSQNDLLLSEETFNRMAGEKEPLLLTDGFKNDSRFTDIQELENIKSSIIIPLIGKNGSLGILNINRLNNNNQFNRNDLNKAAIFASLVTLSIENAQLYHRLQSTQSQVIQQSKLASIGELASGLAHELNNPMTAILGNAQVLLTEIPNENPWHTDIKVIEESAERCKRIVNNMLVFARQQKISVQTADIQNIIEDTLNLCLHQLTVGNIVIVKKYHPNPIFVEVTIPEIQQVFLNIILNAQQAMETGGTLTIATKLAESEIEIYFADTGNGIKKEYLAKIFDPFFTTKEIGKGTGLGLSISYGIIQKHNGTILAESEGEGKGARFTIILPVSKNI